MHFALALKAVASCGVHQSLRLPFLSNCRPSSSKPCVDSWPMTAPIAPKLTAHVGVLVEERRLQNTGWEDDFVHRWVVIRIDRRRRHAPLASIDGFADLRVVALTLVSIRCQLVDDEGFLNDREIGVVAPRIRITNLQGKRVEFLDRPRLGLRGHPIQRRDVGAQRLLDVLDQLERAGFSCRREDLGYVLAPERVAERAVGKRAQRRHCGSCAVAPFNAVE